MIRVIRVVTASQVVPWHLHNFLVRGQDRLRIFVAGEGVSRFKDSYPCVTFVDIPMSRKPALFVDLRATLSLFSLFRKVKPDIVHSVMPKAGLLSAIAGVLCRVPVRMHTFTGQVWTEMRGSRLFFYLFLDKIVCFLNTCCLTDSRSQSAFLFSYGISKASRQLGTILNGSLSGVDLRRFNETAVGPNTKQLAAKLGLEKGVFVFCFLARKTEKKGARIVLEAFRRLRLETSNIVLLFVGPDEDGLVSQIRENTPELLEDVIDIGTVSEHENYLALADVLLLPSSNEGFGSIVIEAAAMGVPTIGSRVPGLVEAVSDGITGLLFTVGDIDELVLKMKMLCQDEDLRSQLARNGRSRVVADFSADRHFEALISLYREQLDS